MEEESFLLLLPGDYHILSSFSGLLPYEIEAIFREYMHEVCAKISEEYQRDLIYMEWTIFLLAWGSQTTNEI